MVDVARMSLTEGLNEEDFLFGQVIRIHSLILLSHWVQMQMCKKLISYAKKKRGNLEEALRRSFIFISLFSLSLSVCAFLTFSFSF